jgi:hypothetical protein
MKQKQNTNTLAFAKPKKNRKPAMALLFSFSLCFFFSLIGEKKKHARMSMRQKVHPHRRTNELMCDVARRL